MDKPLKGGAVGGAFSLDDSRDARRRMFELRFNGRLRDTTVLRIVDNARMKYPQRHGDSIVQQRLKCADNGCSSVDRWHCRVGHVPWNVLAGSDGNDVSDGCVRLVMEQRRSSSEIVPQEDQSRGHRCHRHRHRGGGGE